jgi:DNA-directed RNA polymerase specialized sigma24 family protein
MHVQLAQPGETVSLSEDAIAGDFPGIRFDPERVKAWARQCASLLGRKEAQAFSLYENEGCGPSEIARRLGYRSASGAKYAIERAMQAMKGFMRDLPWVSPDDLDEEAFSLFRDEIIDSLKNRFRDP